MKAEGDVVASTKEAEQAGQQLIKERETLAEKIQKLKVPFQRMITFTVDGRSRRRSEKLESPSRKEFLK